MHIHGAVDVVLRELVSHHPATAAPAKLHLMFCDLVGSTALSARLDPEDLREVIGAYHAAVAEVVGRFDGLVAKYMGDGVLAYFGYPQAHEDDPERAVGAGLAVVEAVRSSKDWQRRCRLSVSSAKAGWAAGSRRCARSRRRSSAERRSSNCCAAVGSRQRRVRGASC
jgi:class 3 adenylate cyclase